MIEWSLYLMNKKIVTFIIVTWNNEHQIEACLDTIKLFTTIPHEVIIVDNVSKDSTCDIISTKYPDVQLIKSKENLGFAKGNNLALEKVMTPYLCFINPDVVLTEDIAGPALKVLEEHDNIGLVTNKLYNEDGSNQKTTGRFTDFTSVFLSISHLSCLIPNTLRKTLAPEYYKINKGYFFPDWVIGAEMFMRTTDAKKIDGFSTEYYMYMEDMDICKKVQSQLHKKIFYNADVSMVHLGGASEKQNRSYSKQEKIYINTFLFCEKFYGKKRTIDINLFMIRLYEIRKTLLYPWRFSEKGKLLFDHDEMVIQILKNIRKNKI